MTISIHQPDYLPWLGYFNKIKKSNIFIFLDSATYSRNGFHNRNKIKTSQGWCYLTIPINRSQYFLPLNEVRLPNDTNWAKKHWKTIETNYRQAKYWSCYNDFFQDLYNKKVKEFRALADLNIYIIEYFCNQFRLTVKILRDSEMSINHELKASKLLVEIIKNLEADYYYSGPSGKKYLDKDLFNQSNIKIEFQEFKQLPYPQLFGNFIPGLSAIDLLFNCGPDANAYL